MNKKIRIVELFSGIGSQVRALKNIGYDVDVVATCEWDMKALIAYDYIQNGKHVNNQFRSMKKEDMIAYLKDKSLSIDGKKPVSKNALKHYDVEFLRAVSSSISNTNNLVDVSRIDGDSLPEDIDLLTYSFPCQDLSNVGAFHGYTKGIDKNSGSRSSLLWEVGRILEEMKRSNKTLPKYLVMENVPSLLSERHIDNFNLWKNQLENLGYVSKEFLLNAKHFGLPQNRPRLLMLSIRANGNSKKKKAEKLLNSMTSESIVKDYCKSVFYKKISIRKLIRTDYSVKKYYEEALTCNPNNTESRKKIWNENPKIVDENGNIISSDCIRTITTKQDRHPNSGNLYFDSGISGRCKWRYLTPRECMLFMGFTDNDYETLIKNNIPIRNSVLFPRDKIIRMAGNSIPVKLLEGFFYQIHRIDRELFSK